LDSNGMVFNMPGVEYRSLSIHLTSAGTSQPVLSWQPFAVAPANSFTDTASEPISQATMASLIILFVLFFATLGVMGYFLFVRPSKHKPRSSRVIVDLSPATSPVLVHGGHPIPLHQNHKWLGHHTEISKRDGAFYLIDTGSHQGTFLNGNRLGAGYHLLHDGDQVHLGNGVPYRFVEPQAHTQ